MIVVREEQCITVLLLSSTYPLPTLGLPLLAREMQLVTCVTLPSAIRRTHSRTPAAVWLARRSGWMRGLASALHPRAVHSVSYLDQHRRLPLCC